MAVFLPVFCIAPREIHTFANTFSTVAVKTILNPLNSCEVFVKIDPGDRELYRNGLAATDLVRSHVVVKETDLLVLSDKDIGDLVRDIVLTQRDRLERYIAGNPTFRESLVPVDVADTAPGIVRSMALAGQKSGVGPMAAVAGAVCEAVAVGVGERVRELILENGGDLYVASARERVVGIFVGQEVRGGTIGLRLAPERTPIGVCTSSGRIGHSLSLGDSAAATVLARSSALADAAATAVGNRVRGRHGVREGLAAARDIPGVLGVVVLRDGQLGAWGDVEIVGLRDKAQA
jgi:ApbE superfamily uncharacterized protein (UPF0280 family)